MSERIVPRRSLHTRVIHHRPAGTSQLSSLPASLSQPTSVDGHHSRSLALHYGAIERRSSTRVTPHSLASNSDLEFRVKALATAMPNEWGFFRRRGVDPAEGGGLNACARRSTIGSRSANHSITAQNRCVGNGSSLAHLDQLCGPAAVRRACQWGDCRFFGSVAGHRRVLASRRRRRSAADRRREQDYVRGNVHAV